MAFQTEIGWSGSGWWPFVRLGSTRGPLVALLQAPFHDIDRITERLLQRLPLSGVRQKAGRCKHCPLAIGKLQGSTYCASTQVVIRTRTRKVIGMISQDMLAMPWISPQNPSYVNMEKVRRFLHADGVSQEFWNSTVGPKRPTTERRILH